MKRNYIERLKEYDARTSLKHKQSLYSRKFIKTCYNEHNKQNQDPNIRKHISLKSDKKSQRDAQETKSSEKRECKDRAREVSQFKEISSPCLEAKKAILASIRLQCVNWQRYLSSRESGEVEKCKLYYQTIQDELSKQQISNISFIQSLYSHNKRIIQDKMAQISEWLEHIDSSFLSPLLFKQLLGQDTSVQLQMATVALNTDISKFDLMNLGFLQKNSQQHSPIPAQQTKMQALTSINESLTCPQELIDVRDTRKIIDQLDISFQNCQEFQQFGHCLAVSADEAEECSISPSFKHF